MSLDSIGLTIEAITPPDGLAHTNRKQEILDLPTYLTVNAASASDELNVLFVSSDEPLAGDRDKVWLKPDTNATASGIIQPGVYLYDAVTGAWQLKAGLGIFVGATAPSDTKVLWLNTTSGTNAVGLYWYNGSAWVTVANLGVYSGTTAPADTTVIWLKTDDTTTNRGLYIYVGSAWVSMTPAFNLMMPTGTAIVLPSATAPASGVRSYTLWAKNDNPPYGLFWADDVNGWWVSVHPISFSYRYPAALTVTIPAVTLEEYNGIPYSTICPTIGTAVFMEEPMMTVMLEDDTLFDTPTAYMNIGVVPHLTTFDIAGYNGHASLSRDIAFRVSAVGRMKIPF